MGIHDGHREKMRQRFLKGGLDSFADHEALELLLYYAIPRRDTNPIAHALMERYGSLSAVLTAPVEDLQKVEGIGESEAQGGCILTTMDYSGRSSDSLFCCGAKPMRSQLTRKFLYFAPSFSLSQIWSSPVTMTAAPFTRCGSIFDLVWNQVQGKKWDSPRESFDASVNVTNSVPESDLRSWASSPR